MEAIHIFTNESTLNHFSNRNIIEHVTTELLVTTLLVVVCIKLSVKLANLHKSTKHSFISDSIIPSLPTLPVIGPLHKLVFSTDQAKVIKSWISKYGYSFRTKILGKEIVVLSNPKWLQKLLSSTEPGHLQKLPIIYEIIFPEFLRSGLPATSKIPAWRQHRLAYAKAFTMNSLKIYLKLFNRHGLEFVKSLHNSINNNFQSDAGTGNHKNSKTLHHSIHHVTFQIICEVVIGADILTKDEIENILWHFLRCQNLIAYRTLHPWCWLDSVWNRHPKKRDMDHSFKFIQSIVTEKFLLGKEQLERENHQEQEGKASIMDFLTRSNLSADQIYTELSNSLSAGHETTSVSIEYVLFHLALHVHHQDECRREIDRVWNSLPTNNAGHVEITMDALSEMKYLERCIKETLRLFPVIPIVLRQLSTPLKLEENLVLKSGTVVIVSPTLVHRDPAVYSEPNNYNPDRFLPEESSNRSLYSFLTFSQGPRNCIGWKMAMIEMKLLVCYILRHFEVYTTNTMENLEKKMSSSPWPYEDIGVLYRELRSCSQQVSLDQDFTQ